MATKPTEHSIPVLIAGGGPAGLLLALQLANHGVHCMIVERNLDTTHFPKMDITNCRSMELFKHLGIADGFRKQGVPQHFSFDVLFSSGLAPGGQLITKWDLPSPDWWRDQIQKTNDGTMPREPYQRCSQAVLEAWLKPQLIADPYIDGRWGWKHESFLEKSDGIESTLTDVTNGHVHIVHSQYLIGCDGAGSRIRKQLGIELDGGPSPLSFALIHFESRDLNVLHKQGQFWHIFFSHGGILISQDEEHTWTIHAPIGQDTNIADIDALETIYTTIGAATGTCSVQVDRIMFKSKWQPAICLADRYVSPGGRVFLSGDAAHQNIPTGGYGMNTAVGDSFDLGWKLSAVLNGYGGSRLLASYEDERRPVAKRNIQRSGDHAAVHGEYAGWSARAGNHAILADDETGQLLRDRMCQHVTQLDGENKDHGIELGYRYNGSPVVIADTETEEPKWTVRDYIPSTWPGARPPHVWLADGKTSIFDLFGKDFSIVDFTTDGDTARKFAVAAKKLSIPLATIHLPNEPHVKELWEREAVLIRPDDHVAWRASSSGPSDLNAETILKIVTGRATESEV